MLPFLRDFCYKRFEFDSVLLPKTGSKKLAKHESPEALFLDVSMECNDPQTGV